MFNEITSLRSTVNVPLISQFDTSTSPYLQPASPVSPVSQHSTYQPVFVQGSSNGGVNQNTYQIDQLVQPQTSQLNHTSPPHLKDSPRLDIQLPRQAITPDPSPQLTSLETSTPSSSSGSHHKEKRRRKSNRLSDDGSISSSSSSDSSRPRKRSNHHDTRCYTIQVRFLLFFGIKLRCSVLHPILPACHAKSCFSHDEHRV